VVPVETGVNGGLLLILSRVIELHVSIICVCVAHLKPFFEHHFPRLLDIRPVVPICRDCDRGAEVAHVFVNDPHPREGAASRTCNVCGKDSA
jgi:hypothetical protein